jgi:hypothetical protein
MAFPMPLVVPKSRTVTLGGASLARVTITEELNAQYKADVHSALVGITREETAQQIRLDNPPQLLEVDDRTNKPVDQAERKVVVLFGTFLSRAAMQMVENALRSAIANSTNARSGRLRDVASSWEWRFIPAGGSARKVSAANPPTTLARGDRLVLVPVNVPYATAVNRSVLHGRPGVLKGRLRTGGRGTRDSGFLAAATRDVKRRAEFKQFAIYAEFTTAHAIPGEVYAFERGGPKATGVITIRPRYRRA